MKFSTKEDIEAPIDYVFKQVSDFQSFERSALRRGAEVKRIDTLRQPGPGMAWDIEFVLRGKQRELQIELTRYDPPNEMLMASRSASIGGHMVVELVALSRGRTRLSVGVELKPKTLPARLLVQSLKLARSNLSQRFKNRVADYAKDMEERYGRTA